MSLTKKVRAICRNRPRDANGVTCAFYKLNATSGVKLYNRRRNAKLTHELHTKAAADGLAPPILSNIFAVKCNPFPKNHWKHDHIWAGYRTYYAYLVGLATLAHESLEVTSVEYSRQLHQLKLELKEAGYCADDVGGTNWGHYKGKPVCIDFSHFEDIYGDMNKEY